MARRRQRMDRVGVLLLGVLAGLVLSLLFVYTYVNRSRNRVIEERVRATLGLPRQAFTLEKVEADGSLRVLLRDVAFLDRQGDTIVSAPTARARLLAGSLAGNGPIVFDQGEIVRPYLRLWQDAKGEWNFYDIFAVQAGGKPVQSPGGEGAAAKPLVFRGVRIVDGRARIATPTTAPATPAYARFVSGRTPDRARFRGRWFSIHTLTGINANLTSLRMGGAGGWRVDIGSARANVSNPDTRIEAVAGWVEQSLNGPLRFDINTFRTPYSSFAAAGSMRTQGNATLYDVRMRAHPLDLRDLAGMGFPVPRQGTAEFALDIHSIDARRTRWTVTDARVAVLGSRMAGRLTAVTSPGAQPVFSDTRLTLDPLRLSDLETLGFAEHLPLLGEVTGTVTSLSDLETGRGGALRVDLAAHLVPRTSNDAPASTVAARGVVRVGGKAGFAFDGLRVEAEPVELATFRSLASPAQQAYMRGTLRGGATLSGTMSNLRITGGDLAYQVGDAPESRLRDLSGTVQMQPSLRYRISARAEPLALATLTELFPSLPFRSATLSGPITLSGTRQSLAFDTDLSGSAGGIAMRGTLGFGAVTRFDVSGRLSAFRSNALLTASNPLQGPLSGTFAARGTTEDFHFNVDMAQGAGSFALAGQVRRPGGGAAQFDVAGRVNNFDIGVLAGRPNLLGGPVSGPIRVSGGGRQPYRFDVDLRGQVGVLAVNGWYAPGTVPTYAVAGTVAALDVSGLPGFSALPRTRLTGTLSINGRGTTPETFAGRFELAAQPGSTIGGIVLESGIARFTAESGVMRVDTLLFAARGLRLEAKGGLGLTRPSPVPLTFSLNAPNLALLRPLLPGADTLPELSGSIAAAGVMTGTIRSPAIAANGRVQGLQYGAWAAGALTFDFNGAKEPRGWRGTAKLDGRALEFSGTHLDALTLELNATPERASFGLSLRRDPQTDVTASGTLELAGLAVRGVVLDNLGVRIAGTDWKLAQRARIAWTAERGLEVENLLLQRSGGTGSIVAEGVLPPHGSADFRLRLRGVDLAEAHHLFPATVPDAAGILGLDAEIRGPVNDPRLAIDARVDSLRYGGVVSDSVQIRARYAAGRMEVQGGVRAAGREVLNATASIPMRLTLGGTIPGFDLLRDQPLTADVLADSIPLALITETFPTFVKDGAGVARAHIAVRGTPARVRVSGDATVTGGALTPVTLGAKWTNINGRVSLSGDTIRVDSVTAESKNGGRALLNGVVRLDDAANPAMDLALWTNDFQVADNRKLAVMQSTSRLRLGGRLRALEISGTLGLEDGTVYVPSVSEPGELDITNADVGAIGADTVRAPAGAAALLAGVIARNLNVHIGESVWLESPDARIQIAGDLLIDHPGPSNVIFGELQAKRGSYTFKLGPFERQFDIVQGVVRFYGTPELNPALDITAANVVRGGEGDEPLRVLVHLGGTLQNPQVALSSESRQPLSSSELASILLLGRGGDQVAGLPENIARGLILEEALGGLITNQLEESLIKTRLVDYVRVRARGAAGNAAGGAASSFGLDFLGPLSIEAGKEVISNVYITAELVDFLSPQPKLGGGVDWQISPTLSLRAAYEPVRRDPLLRNLFRLHHQATVDLRRRWEYGRPHVRPDNAPRRTPPTPKPGQPSTPENTPPAPAPTPAPAASPPDTTGTGKGGGPDV